MAASSSLSQTAANRKALALKRKLQQQGSHKRGGSKPKHQQLKATSTETHDRRIRRSQRERALASASRSAGSPTTTAGIARKPPSIKHSAGRKDACLSLDQTIANSTQINEALRGIGGNRTAPAVVTAAEAAQKARDERERMAVAYEQHQVSVNETIDELAHLMSG
ncbi:hypothetical protein LPJ72_002863 [Coemansia sp. Benny D160-2]|nr:hypothetical protein LPJ72_002863 [Coemansia sp. Benny D160-2]